MPNIIRPNKDVVLSLSREDCMTVVCGLAQAAAGGEVSIGRLDGSGFVANTRMRELAYHIQKAAGLTILCAEAENELSVAGH